MAAPFRLGVAGIAIFLVSAIFGFWGFDKFLRYKIGENVGLRKDGEMRKLWSKVPIPVEFRIYVFNLTNPQEVHEGAKPKVQEIGPYFFDEWKEKVKLTDDPTEDTVSFNQRTTFIFHPEKSGPGLTGNEIITIPHAALLSMVMTVEREKPGALPMISKALPALFNSPSTIFLTARLMDILFEGVPINCTSKDFGPKAICTMIRANPKGLKQQGEDIFLFSFFGMKNGSIEDGRFTVKRGIQNPKDVGKVVAFNGKPALEVWSGPECNAFQGTDSTIFPPFISEEDELASFAPDLCRSMGAKFKKYESYKGIDVFYYTASLGDMSSNEEEKCFCPTPDTCLKKGAFDITKCVGAPITLTLPHFYDADPSYLNEVDGLHPEEDKHQIFIYFEPITGTPLAARKRLQFNMRIHPIKKVALMKNLPEAMIPLFWVEEGLELSQEFIDILDAKLFRSMRIVGVSKWVLMLLGLAMVAGGVMLHYYRQKSIGITTDNKKNHPKTVQVEAITPPKY